MKILLTGATGLIGREVGKLLSEAGHEVVSLTRDGVNGRATMPFQCRVLEWKGAGFPFSQETLEGFRGIDGVVHLMGENIADNRWSKKIKDRLVKSRVDASQELIMAIFGVSNPQFWIHGSAIGFYGVSDGEVFYDEESPAGQGFLPELCKAWEATLSSLPSQCRRVILRTGVVLSHQGGAFPKMLLPLLNGIGSVIGSGRQLMSPIHLTDVARFIVHAVQQNSVQGIYNLVAGEPRAQKDVVERLCYWLNVSSGPRVPAFAVRAALGEMSTLVLDSLGVRSRRLSESGFRLKYPDLDSMLSEVTQWTLHPFRPKEPVFVQYVEQFVPKPLEEIFPFFSDARNLEAITPEWLHFKIKKVTPEEIRKGTRIRYRLRLHGLPLGWLTDIAEWEPPVRFVDNQLKGPYSLWYHEHTFHPVKGGTLIRDWVRFQLPLGKLGKWVGYPKVHSDVQKIFEYRKRKILEILGQ
jgi:hypothetical protein